LDESQNGSCGMAFKPFEEGVVYPVNKKLAE